MAAKKTEPTPKQPEAPKKITVEFSQEDWQHNLAMLQVGAKKMVDDIVSKANSIIQTIESAMPPAPPQQ